MLSFFKVFLQFWDTELWQLTFKSDHFFFTSAVVRPMALTTFTFVVTCSHSTFFRLFVTPLLCPPKRTEDRLSTSPTRVWISVSLKGRFLGRLPSIVQVTVLCVTPSNIPKFHSWVHLHTHIWCQGVELGRNCGWDRPPSCSAQDWDPLLGNCVQLCCGQFFSSRFFFCGQKFALRSHARLLSDFPAEFYR